MHRLILLMLSATVLLFVLASAAAAEPPVVVTGQTPSVNSGYCSFPVYRSDVFKLTTIAKPDGTLITHIDRVLTFTANGKTLTSNDHFTRFVDPTRPYLIDISGHLIGVELPIREAGGHHDTYGFALAAHPGKSQGRPPTNAGSQPILRDRPAHPA